MIVSEDERLDFSKVPASKGIPQTIVHAGLIGLLMIFALGASVVLLSGYGHLWPSNTTLRAPLGNLNH